MQHITRQATWFHSQHDKIARTRPSARVTVMNYEDSREMTGRMHNGDLQSLALQLDLGDWKSTCPKSHTVRPTLKSRLPCAKERQHLDSAIMPTSGFPTAYKLHTYFTPARQGVTPARLTGRHQHSANSGDTDLGSSTYRPLSSVAGPGSGWCGGGMRLYRRAGAQAFNQGGLSMNETGHEIDEMKDHISPSPI